MAFIHRWMSEKWNLLPMCIHNNKTYMSNSWFMPAPGSIRLIDLSLMASAVVSDWLDVVDTWLSRWAPYYTREKKQWKQLHCRSVKCLKTRPWSDTTFSGIWPRSRLLARTRHLCIMAQVSQIKNLGCQADSLTNFFIFTICFLIIYII